MSRLTALDLYIWGFDILRAIFLIGAVFGSIVLAAVVGAQGLGVIGGIVVWVVSAGICLIFAAICDELASNAEQYKSLEIEYNNRSGR